MDWIIDLIVVFCPMLRKSATTLYSGSGQMETWIWNAFAYRRSRALIPGSLYQPCSTQKRGWYGTSSSCCTTLRHGRQCRRIVGPGPVGLHFRWKSTPPAGPSWTRPESERGRAPSRRPPGGGARKNKRPAHNLKLLVGARVQVSTWSPVPVLATDGMIVGIQLYATVFATD